jgi:hypothetical protein
MKKYYGKHYMNIKTELAQARLDMLRNRRDPKWLAAIKKVDAPYSDEEYKANSVATGRLIRVYAGMYIYAAPAYLNCFILRQGGRWYAYQCDLDWRLIIDNSARTLESAIQRWRDIPF